ncbi:hypothetical protein CANDROIZ_60011 [Candidatus Roizmanbacteria bacterium]|nr:hypothetical protein CANDROIZ_60011 [Candidatus Roizmanbacteria bacterium]
MNMQNKKNIKMFLQIFPKEKIVLLENILKDIEFKCDLKEYSIVQIKRTDENETIISALFEKYLLSNIPTTDVSGVFFIDCNSDDYINLKELKEYLKFTYQNTKEIIITRNDIKRILFKNNELFINDISIKFNDGKGRISLLEKIFKQKKKVSIDIWAGEYTELSNKYKNNFYNMCKAINQRIELKTGLKDFLKFSTNYVEIDPYFFNFLKK